MEQFSHNSDWLGSRSRHVPSQQPVSPHSVSGTSTPFFQASTVSPLSSESALHYSMGFTRADLLCSLLSPRDRRVAARAGQTCRVYLFAVQRSVSSGCLWHTFTLTHGSVKVDNNDQHLWVTFETTLGTCFIYCTSLWWGRGSILLHFHFRNVKTETQ